MSALWIRRRALGMSVGLAAGVCLFVAAFWPPRVHHRSSEAGKPGNERDPHSGTGLTLQRLQRLSDLVTVKVDVADVQVTGLDGYTGGQKAILLVKGDFLLGVDLSRARLESVDQAARTAVLVLPPPAVRSPRLDQERTRLFTVSSQGLWQLVPGDAGQTAVVNDAYRHAQRVVAAAASEIDLLAECRRNTEKALACFFDAAGWHVTIRWSDPVRE